MKIADDEAPGVLVLQSNGSTNIVEPSPFVILGDGFVTALLATCGVAGTSVTCFNGAFGTSEANETTYHGSIPTAQDLDLASWGKNANPDVANATTIPHVTIHGTGDGTDDYYKFVVTPKMLTDAGNSMVVSFDVDHGYKTGDSVIWASLLKLYDQSGNLLAQGAGQSSPSVGAGGSTTFLDDFLSTTITHSGTYYIRVGAWKFTGSIPVGASYDLQVSVPQHDIAGFVFSPSPVPEQEGTNSTGAGQSIDDAQNFYNFFNGNVGDVWDNSGGTGTITSQTPYAQVVGTGDGSFDIYSFVITPQMLNPQAATTSNSSTAVSGRSTRAPASG